MPVIRLKTVVFPAPLGPITLTISWGLTTRLTSCTAARPPKYLVTLLKSSNASLLLSAGSFTRFTGLTLIAQLLFSWFAATQHAFLLRSLALLAPHPTSLPLALPR